MFSKTREGSDLLSSIPIIVLMSLVLLTIGVGLPSVSADNYGIRYDNTCKTLLKNNVTTNCPTYEDIITLFPDTSNRKITGDFGYYHGLYQRLPTRFIDSFEYYRFSDTPILFIDPPAETANRIKIIEIKANLKEYLLPKDKTYNDANYSLTLGYGRYVDSCRTAFIDASQWAFLLGDTMFYMQHGCSPDSTKFNSTRTTYLQKVKHDISTTYKWKLEQWQKQSIERCGQKICIYGKNQTAPP